MRTITSQVGCLLFGKVRLGVLGVLYGQPDRSFYLREIARTAGISPGPVQRELVALYTAGVVSREIRGRQVFFQAEKTCPIYSELTGIALKLGGVEPAPLPAPSGSRPPAGAGPAEKTDVSMGSILSAALEPLADRFRVAVASVDGTRPGSPITLMVLGKATVDDLEPALSPIREQLHRPLTLLVMRRKEFRRRMKSGDGVILRLMAGQWSVVAGDREELKP